MEQKVTRNFFALTMGIALYLSYLIIILPWRTFSYMTIPLGVFFGFTVAILVAPLLERLTNKTQVFLAIIFLMFNMFPASTQLLSFAQYNHDTVNLLKWIDEDPYVQNASFAGKHFGCNGMEPAAAISNLVKLIDHKEIALVLYTPKVRDIVSDGDMVFYFYNTRFGDQDLRRLNDMWTTVFISKNWIVFRRNY